MDLGAITAHDAVDADSDLRPAAVIVPVVERPNGPHVLFTKRAEHLEDHPGQMSFPGGGYEPEDDDLRATARREADEEIGLDPAEPSFHGRLDDFETVTHYVIRPFVATVPDRPYEPGDDEVAEIAVLALADILDPDNYETEMREHPSYGRVRLHYFHVDGYTVWGATAAMLVQFLELATDWESPPDPEQVLDHDADSLP
ncbi:NUDIX domain-containing protein [Halapricum sp. CBA1109]|uniref:NUDIX hydrolase n=1 Tax=Halapricum sp. CBA1109 TaxID=2668068 RepID=UPI0012FA3990|nr:CoA pyrophosphatase [Halapricum sp. CBA1109]MUV89621.1 NUDIX domain-containing protein [Halapricum sp. CBA1109]